MAGAPHGGAEMAFVDMCLALNEAGQEVEAVTRPNDLRVSMLRKAGLKVHLLPFGGMLDLATMRDMKRIIHDFRPRIVQTWMSRAAQKTPAWSSAMGIPPYLVVSRLGGYYKLRHFRQTAYFTAITPDIRRFLIDNGIAEDHIRHINNFAETEIAHAPASRAKENTPENAPVLLSLGRLHPSKAFDTLLKALADLPGVWLWIAGEGPMRQELESLCARLGLNDRVRFLGWRDDRAALLQACDLCVFPSRYEPFGTVFVQAWSQCVPVVSTMSDGPRQYIRDGEDGLLAPIDDVAALASAIRRGLQDDALRARMVENGYRRYRDEFTKENTVAQYLDYYQNILDREFASGPDSMTK
jgi:glycosyltransferase involved in cell wall biosynthesis